jgi:type II secretory pathway pseudopilin PulG
MSGEAGQAGLEMLVVLLILALLLFGALSLAQGVSARHALENGTAVAARQIALDPASWSRALDGVQDAVDHSLFGAGGAVSCDVVDDAGGSVPNPTLLQFDDPFAVVCSLPFEPAIPFVATAPRTLTSRHYEIVERYP